MPIRKYTLAVPFTRQPGDEVRIIGQRVELWRAGVKIEERNLADEENSLLVEADYVGSGLVQSVYVEVNMPGVVATLTGVSINQGTGAMTANWSDGSQDEFIDWADFVEKNGVIDTDVSTAKKILLNKLLGVTPDGSNLDALNGSSCAMDRNAAEPVQVSLTV